MKKYTIIARYEIIAETEEEAIDRVADILPNETDVIAVNHKEEHDYDHPCKEFEGEDCELCQADKKQGRPDHGEPE